MPFLGNWVEPHAGLLPYIGDFQAGRDAYNCGDYDTALKEFRPLAEQGYVKAQHSLAVMYNRGSLRIL